MARLIRSVLLVFSVLFLLAPLILAEEITITTYYPSPYGSYNELQLYPHATPVATCNAAAKGTMYYDSDDDKVHVCNGSAWQFISVGGPNYQSASTSIGDHGTATFAHNLGYIPHCIYTSSNENQVLSIRSISTTTIVLYGWSPTVGQSTNVVVYCW